MTTSGITFFYSDLYRIAKALGDLSGYRELTPNEEHIRSISVLYTGWEENKEDKP